MRGVQSRSAGEHDKDEVGHLDEPAGDLDVVVLAAVHVLGGLQHPRRVDQRPGPAGPDPRGRVYGNQVSDICFASSVYKNKMCEEWEGVAELVWDLD